MADGLNAQPWRSALLYIRPPIVFELSSNPFPGYGSFAVHGPNQSC